MQRHNYKNPSLLILDEPTAALDALAEKDLYEEYKEITKDKSTFFISHRLASTRFCDNIVFLENGEIIEQGTHEQLMKLMVNTQRCLMYRQNTTRRKNKMKLKQFYQQTHDLIQLLKVQFPHITVQMLTLAFCRSTPNFIVLFGYSRILDLLLTSQFQNAIQVVTIMLVSSYLLSSLVIGLILIYKDMNLLQMK